MTPIRKIIVATGFAMSVLATGVAVAADYQFLAHGSLIGQWPGLDGYWDSGDEAAVPGLNTIGAASTGTDNVGNYAFYTGTFETNSSAPAFFGINALTATSVSGEVNNNFVPFFNSPYSQTFDPGVVNTFTIQSDNTANASFGLDQADAFGGHKISVTGSYVWMLPGQDPAVLFAGQTDLINHIEFLLPLLPGGWTFFGTGLESFTYTAGINIGGTGTSSKVFYSLDPNASVIPLPAGLPLLVSALASLAAGGALRRSKRRA